MPNPTTLDDPRAARTARGLIAEAMAAQVLGVKGHITVEIIDDRTGRVVQQLDSPNYVNTDMWERFAQALQKSFWTFGYQGDSSTVTNDPINNLDPRQVPSIRGDMVACWTDATAEDAADIFAFGEVVAWAHRWQQGSPSTRQGIVQPTLCTLTVDAVSWVWEWATSNGNGTFQSVGWRRLGYVANTGDTALYDFPMPAGRTVSAGGDATGTGTGLTATYTAGASQIIGGALYYDSGSGLLYAIQLTAAGMKLTTSAVTIDGTSGNLTIAAAVDASAAAFAAGLGGDNVAQLTRTATGITRLGASGDWISVGYTGSSTARRPFVRRTTNAGVLSYTNVNVGTYAVESAFLDVTYDGTDVWLVALNGNTGAPAIHRVTAATGAISATITTIAGLPAYAPNLSTTNGLCGIEWDATNGWFWIVMTTGYIMNIDASGNWLGVLLGARTPNAYPISPSTLTGQHNADRADPPGFAIVDPWRMTFAADNPAANSQTEPYHQAVQQVPQGVSAGQLTASNSSKLTAIGTDIFFAPAYGTSNQGTPAGAQRQTLTGIASYPNFATRTLLASPATKNSSQTMRIRYTLTFT